MRETFLPLPASISHGSRRFMDYCMENRIPFAFYRLPVLLGRKKNKNKPLVVAQINSDIIHPPPAKDYSKEKGFLFAPFYENLHYKKVFIRPDIFTTIDNLPTLNFVKPSSAFSEGSDGYNKLSTTTEGQFSAYVRKIKLNVWRNKFRKVVAARTIEIIKPKSFHPAEIFLRLCKEYPGAFVSVVYVPLYGCWIGATPELLLCSMNGAFSSHSLAGTKSKSSFHTKKDWGEKEKEEQKLVSDYIVEAYKKVTGQTPEVTHHGTIKAGNVMHLRTDFQLNQAPVESWQKLVEELHPSPAVAGLPKKEAITFILKSETSDRGFYSGYLGPVNLDESIHLYVNLRCMNVLSWNLVLHVGAGITLQSDVSQEWKETNMKANTLLRVVKAQYRIKNFF